MDRELLELKPTRFLCPYCGEWHEWKSPNTLDWYDSKGDSYRTECSGFSAGVSSRGCYKFYFDDNKMYYSTDSVCGMAHMHIESSIEVKEILFSSMKPIVYFDHAFVSANKVGRVECSGCDSCIEKCNPVKLGDAGDGRNMTITFGFEFDEEDYRKATKKSTAITPGTSIKTILYEKSPKENVELLKEWSEQYKPTLKWVIPVVAVYGAYKILSSKEFDLSVNNISEIAEKKLGVKIDLLDNKGALKELITIGGISAGAYGAMKAAFEFISNKEKDITVEDIETGMDEVKSLSPNYASILPTMEDMLPIALSVIMVYVALHKPQFNGKIIGKVKDLAEDLQIKIGTYVDLAKAYIKNKFNIDLSDEEQQKKMKVCAFFVAVIGIFVFLYGKKVLSEKNAEESDTEEVSGSVKNCVESAKTLIKKMAPTVYTSLVTYFVSKKLLELDEDINVIETEAIIETKDTNVANEDGKKKGKKSKEASSSARKKDVTSEDSTNVESKEETPSGDDAEDSDDDKPPFDIDE